MPSAGKNRNSGLTGCRFCSGAAALFLLFGAFLLPVDAAGQPLSPFRTGFSADLLAGVNETDARAGLRAWGLTVAVDRGIPVEPDVRVFKNTREMQIALQKKEVDVVSVSSVEYAFLRRKVNFAPLFLVRMDGELAEEYLLVVHRSGPVKSIKDLAGRHIKCSTDARNCLAPLWIDTLLFRQGLGSLDSLAGRITRETQITKILLPVFFRQADACIVTRNAFETMVELNPQLGQQLSIIETSPAYVPAMMAFRADYQPPYLKDLLEGVRSLHQTAAGRQVLLIFNSERIEEHPAAILQPTLELIEAHARLSKGKVPQ
ncbi:MAG: PhnD/SsuA/transferrin family substrate-binding protein [Syntrophotaleaceae bacterium]